MVFLSLDTCRILSQTIQAIVSHQQGTTSSEYNLTAVGDTGMEQEKSVIQM